MIEGGSPVLPNWTSSDRGPYHTHLTESDMKDEDKEYVFTKTIRLKNGRVIHAFQYGLKAFRIKVRRSKPA